MMSQQTNNQVNQTNSPPHDESQKKDTKIDEYSYRNLERKYHQLKKIVNPLTKENVELKEKLQYMHFQATDTIKQFEKLINLIHVNQKTKKLITKPILHFEEIYEIIEQQINNFIEKIKEVELENNHLKQNPIQFQEQNNESYYKQSLSPRNIDNSTLQQIASAQKSLQEIQQANSPEKKEENEQLIFAQKQSVQLTKENKQLTDVIESKKKEVAQLKYQVQQVNENWNQKFELYKANFRNDMKELNTQFTEKLQQQEQKFIAQIEELELQIVKLKSEIANNDINNKTQTNRLIDLANQIKQLTSKEDQQNQLIQEIVKKYLETLEDIADIDSLNKKKIKPIINGEPTVLTLNQIITSQINFMNEIFANQQHAQQLVLQMRNSINKVNEFEALINMQKETIKQQTNQIELLAMQIENQDELHRQKMLLDNLFKYSVDHIQFSNTFLHRALFSQKQAEQFYESIDRYFISCQNEIENNPCELTEKSKQQIKILKDQFPSDEESLGILYNTFRYNKYQKSQQFEKNVFIQTDSSVLFTKSTQTYIEVFDVDILCKLEEEKTFEEVAIQTLTENIYEQLKELKNQLTLQNDQNNFEIAKLMKVIKEKDHKYDQQIQQQFDKETLIKELSKTIILLESDIVNLNKQIINHSREYNSSLMVLSKKQAAIFQENQNYFEQLDRAKVVYDQLFEQHFDLDKDFQAYKQKANEIFQENQELINTAQKQKIELLELRNNLNGIEFETKMKLQEQKKLFDEENKNQQKLVKNYEKTFSELYQLATDKEIEETVAMAKFCGVLQIPKDIIIQPYILQEQKEKEEKSIQLENEEFFIYEQSKDSQSRQQEIDQNKLSAINMASQHIIFKKDQAHEKELNQYKEKVIKLENQVSDLISKKLKEKCHFHVQTNQSYLQNIVCVKKTCEGNSFRKSSEDWQMNSAELKLPGDSADVEAHYFMPNSTKLVNRWRNQRLSQQTQMIKTQGDSSSQKLEVLAKVTVRQDLPQITKGYKSKKRNYTIKTEYEESSSSYLQTILLEQKMKKNQLL